MCKISYLDCSNEILTFAMSIIELIREALEGSRVIIHCQYHSEAKVDISCCLVRDHWEWGYVFLFQYRICHPVFCFAMHLPQRSSVRLSAHDIHGKIQPWKSWRPWSGPPLSTWHSPAVLTTRFFCDDVAHPGNAIDNHVSFFTSVVTRFYRSATLRTSEVIGS